MGPQTHQPPQIPVIDLSLEDLKPGSASWLPTCNQIRHALEEYGCFVAKYDQLSPQLSTKLFSQSKDLFELPVETKKQNTSDEPYRGYIGPTKYMPLYESTAIEKATVLEEVHKFMNLMWPDGKDQFCEVVDSYAKLLGALNELTVEMLFESYGLRKHFPSLAASNSHLLRFLKYKQPQDTETTTIRFAAHTDINFATIVHQNDIGGLEVQAKDGTWISVEPQPSHFLIFAGQGMQVWSNDRIKACYHRVKVSAGNGERYSMGLFTFNNGVIQVPEELVDDKHPLLYKPFDSRGYIRFYISSDEAVKLNNPIKAFCGA